MLPEAQRTFSVSLRNRMTLAEAFDYVKDRPRPVYPSLTWLISQLPKDTVIEFPQSTCTFPDLNAESADAS